MIWDLYLIIGLNALLLEFILIVADKFGITEAIQSRSNWWCEFCICFWLSLLLYSIQHHAGFWEVDILHLLFLTPLTPVFHNLVKRL